MYRILEQNTTDWHLHDSAAQNLSKEECDRWLMDLVAKGANPRDLKAVPQDDTRYDGRLPLT